MITQNANYSKFMASHGILQYNDSKKLIFKTSKSFSDWQDTNGKQINVGSDSPTWSYSNDIASTDDTKIISFKAGMTSLSAKNLNDDSTTRQVHLYKTDNAVILLIERLGIDSVRNSHQTQSYLN